VGRQPLPSLLLCVLRLAALDCRIPRRRHPGLLQDTQAAGLLTSSMTRAGTRCRNTSSLSAAAASPSTRHARSRASSRCPIREDVIGSGPPPAGSRPRPSSSRPAAIRRCAAASSSASPCADSRCSISRDPRRETPHDSHRRRTRRGPHCPHVRHQTTSPAAPSAQVQPIRTANPKVSAARLPRTRYREPTQVSTTSWRHGLRRTCRLVTGRKHRPLFTCPDQARLASSRSRTAIIGHFVLARTISDRRIGTCSEALHRP
jgi:hypothetical protein